MIQNLDLPYLPQLQKAAECEKVDIYLVGGYVRDLLLQRATTDIDILVVGDGPSLAKAVARELGNEAKVTVFKSFGTAQLAYNGKKIEFVGARKESYSRGSRNPKVAPGTLEDDLDRRDFTINALALKLNANDDFGTLVDKHGGLRHLDQGLLVTPLEPDTTFADDPLRMLRAVRFASQLYDAHGNHSFYLADSTHDAIYRNANSISTIVQERVTAELNKIMESRLPSVGLKLLSETGLLKKVLPELENLKGTKTIENRSHKDNFYHTLEVIDNVARAGGDLWLRWAALLHDIGKPATKRYDQVVGWTFHGHEVVGGRMVPKIFRKLKLPLKGAELGYVKKLVELHLRPIPLTQEVSDSALRRLLVDAGEDLEDLLLLCKADVTSKNPERKKRYLNRFSDLEEKLIELEERDNLRNWQPPITGEIIMRTFSISPGRQVGVIKDAVREAILEGEVANEYEAAYQYMLDRGNELGLVEKAV